MKNVEIYTRCVRVSVAPWVRQFYKNTDYFSPDGLVFPPGSFFWEMLKLHLTAIEPLPGLVVGPDDPNALKLDITNILSDSSFRNREMRRIGKPNAPRYFLNISDREYMEKILTKEARQILTSYMAGLIVRGWNFKGICRGLGELQGFGDTPENLNIFRRIYDEARRKTK